MVQYAYEGWGVMTTWFHCPPQRFDCGHCDRRDAPVHALTPAVVPQQWEASDPQWRSLTSR
jgi:hypothetical protein